MKKTGSFLAAAAIVCAATFAVSAPSAQAAGVCSQQGFKRQVGGVWHKFVRVKFGRGGTRLVNCGPAW